MKSKCKLGLFSLLLAFTFGLTSCSNQRSLYGSRLMPKDPHTLASKQRVAALKGIANALFEEGAYQGKAAPLIKYRLLRPQQAEINNKKYPLVIVYHGSDGVGTDNNKHLGVLAKLWADPKMQQDYPVYVLAPQFPTRSSNYVLDSGRNVLKSIPQPGVSSALQLIDSLKKKLPIDENRIYVIGFSMGASTVINSLSMRPDLFAAGVSISGIPEFTQVQTLANIPIWLIHGNIDTENPGDSDQQFYKEVSFKHQTRFWQFEGTAHNDIMTNSILGTQIPEWLFKHRKK